MIKDSPFTYYRSAAERYLFVSLWFKGVICYKIRNSHCGYNAVLFKRSKSSDHKKTGVGLQFYAVCLLSSKPSCIFHRQAFW